MVRELFTTAPATVIEKSQANSNANTPNPGLNNVMKNEVWLWQSCKKSIRDVSKLASFSNSLGQRATHNLFCHQKRVGERLWGFVTMKAKDFSESITLTRDLTPIMHKNMFLCRFFTHSYVLDYKLRSFHNEYIMCCC